MPTRAASVDIEDGFPAWAWHTNVVMTRSPNTRAMSDVTQLLQSAAGGDRQAAAQLLPLVYDELRRLAARKIDGERPGQTLDATALVHEAYLRLVGDADKCRWNDRAHFYAAAAQAMRHILVDQARSKRSQKRGGGLHRVDPANLESPAATHDLLAIDDAIALLEAEDPDAAQLVKLRFYAGLSVEQAGECLNLSRPTAYRVWDYAKAWLRTRME